MVSRRFVENAAFALRAQANRRQAIHNIGMSGLAMMLAGKAVGVAAQSVATPEPAAFAAPPKAGPDGIDDRTKDYIAQALWMDEWDESALTPEQHEAIFSEKNSNAALGERMRARLQELIDDPETFTPSYADRYSEFIKYTESLSAHEVYAMSNLLGPDNAKNFEPLPAKVEFVFPDRHAVDLDRQVGWYLSLIHI